LHHTAPAACYPLSLHDALPILDMSERDNGMVMQLTIASSCLHGLRIRRRSLAGRTGCGLCGIESLDDVQRDLPALPERSGFLNSFNIAMALESMDGKQPLGRRTGATHGAAWATLAGDMLIEREDVGRLDEVDRVVGLP